MAAVKSLPVYHHSTGYILFPLGSLPILVNLKIEYAKMALRGECSSQTTVMHMKRLGHTESAIFVISCVL